MLKKYIISGVCILVTVAIFAVLVLGGEKTPQIASAGKAKDEPYCVLVLGRDKVSGLTDVMMLASFDMENQRISVMQIPRDTYSDYGSSYKKLNGATKLLGSEERLCEFLSKTLGVAIDGYVSFDLSAFRNAIDAIGGVEFELEKPIRYSDPEQNLYIDLPAGKRTLDGRQAEMLVRFRSGYLRGDLERLDVQKRFLCATFKKLKKSVNISSAYKLATQLLPQTRTNINVSLFVTLGLKALSVDMSSIALLTLPGEDVISQKSGGSYYVMAAEPTDKVLKDLFYAEGEIDPDMNFKNQKDSAFCEIYSKNFDCVISFASDLE